MSFGGGVLPLRAIDQHIGLIQRLAARFTDHRDSSRFEHPIQRLFGLALDSEILKAQDRPQECGRGQLQAGSTIPRQARKKRFKRVMADAERSDAMRAPQHPPQNTWLAKSAQPPRTRNGVSPTTRHWQARRCSASEHRAFVARTSGPPWLRQLCYVTSRARAHARSNRA